MNPLNRITLLACGILLVSGWYMTSCRKHNANTGGTVNTGDTALSALADTISNHLLFFNATKKRGTVPNGPANSSLKISFKDTLYLVDEIKRPIKFLHKDITKNVAGVFVQLHSASTGGRASDYYDVPEIPDMADSDTVSVIMIGIDPTNLLVPTTLDITITPYDKNHQPIAEATKPVKIDKPKKGPPGNSGTCGLGQQSGERWEWDLSIIIGNGNYIFYSEPFKVHSPEGQDIEGSCCNGNSTWPLFCVGEKKHNRRLHFSTYYQIIFENFTFSGNGSFFRQTMEDSPVPLPDESNFCGSGSGKVRESLKHTTYDGKWSITSVPIPADLQIQLGSSSGQQLSLDYTSSNGTGYGNPGGIIRHLDCENGFLTLIQVDREGSRRHLYKFYVRRKLGDSPWFNFN